MAIYFMRIFAAVLWRGDVKRPWVVKNGDFLVLSVAVSSKALEIRQALLYSNMQSFTAFH